MVVNVVVCVIQVCGTESIQNLDIYLIDFTASSCQAYVDEVSNLQSGDMLITLCQNSGVVNTKI